jgi:pyruvate-formate lyase-activating enzyme/TusA-related sulfurtransferase
MRLEAAIEIMGGRKTFASGLLLDLVAALRTTRAGERIALTSTQPSIGPDLEAWSRLTGHAIVGVTEDGDARRWVIRHGRAPVDNVDGRPVGHRLWLYTNFDCNLRCDYCCVRSSPAAPRRALGLERIRRIAQEAPTLGVRELFVTGGEPFLLPDVGEILRVCARAAPTTVLTNGMLFSGARLETLRSLPRDRVTLQISLDSPTPELHDRHRGAGSWKRAWRGIETVRAEGFRVRLAATVFTDADDARFRAFLDVHRVPAADRVIRRVALRGFAADGVALARADLVPEITITAAGVYWHPVGAEDEDLLVTRDILPLDASFAAVRRAVEREREHTTRVAAVFHCA